MATLSLSDEILALLGADASEHGVAIEARAEELLRVALGRKAKRHLLVKELDRISKLTPPNVAQIDSVVLLREDRDR